MLKGLITFIAIFIFINDSLYAQDWSSEDLSFAFSSFELPRSPNIPVNQLIQISPYVAPGRDGVIAPPSFRIIMGYGSLSIFDALGTDEVAGLKRKDAQKFIEDLRQQGKTEIDGAFIAGLTNIHNGNEFFIFLPLYLTLLYIFSPLILYILGLQCLLPPLKLLCLFLLVFDLGHIFLDLFLYFAVFIIF